MFKVETLYLTKGVELEDSNRNESFSFFAEKVLFYKESKAKSTFAQARYILLDAKVGLIPHFGSMPITEITDDDMEGFLSKVKSMGLTVYDHKKYLKSVFKRARKMRVQLPALDLNVFDAAKGRGKVFTRNELARLLRACRVPKDADISRANRQKLKEYGQQIRLGYTSGCRRGECCGMRWEFIDLKTGWVYLPPWFQKTKSTVDRAFMLQRGMLRILNTRYLRRKPGATHVWPGNNAGGAYPNHRGFQRLLKRAGIDGPARFHDLRYTNATNLLRSKKLISPQHAMKLLGMSPDILKRYTVIQEDVARYAANEALREAI